MMAVVSEKRATLAHLEISLRDSQLIEEVISVLEPFKLVSQVLCTENLPSAGSVIPLLTQLKSHLAAVSTLPSINNMKRAMQADLDKRCTKEDTVNLLNLCAFVDPRFKGLEFLPEGEREDVKDCVANLLVETKLNAVDTASTLRASPVPIVDLEGPSPAKKPASCTESALASLFGGGYFEERAVPMTTYAISDANAEIARYLTTQRVQPDGDPLGFWKENERLFPVLAVMARRYLAVQSSSVASERLFSTAGFIICDRRNRLTSHLADKLIFLSKNMQLN